MANAIQDLVNEIQKLSTDITMITRSSEFQAQISSVALSLQMNNDENGLRNFLELLRNIKKIIEETKQKSILEGSRKTAQFLYPGRYDR